MPVMIVTLSDKNGNQIMDLATGAEAITTTAIGSSYWSTGLAPGEYGRHPPTQFQGSNSVVRALVDGCVLGTHLPITLCRAPADVCAPHRVGLMPQATHTLIATLSLLPIVPWLCTRSAPDGPWASTALAPTAAPQAPVGPSRSSSSSPRAPLLPSVVLSDAPSVLPWLPTALTTEGVLTPETCDNIVSKNMS